MIYSDFDGLKISQLGFGAMRLPVDETGAIDEPQVFEMVRKAAEAGVNYFDTAYPYHGGKSEIVLGRALRQLPRESYYLADKFPGHQIADSYDPKAIFEEQLAKCGVDYFDFYMLHNINEGSLGTYMDPRWGIVDYLLEQKAAGRIKYLGFSAHGTHECMKTFLEAYADKMDFAQIQLNYVDWTLQGGQTKCSMLRKAGLPIIVMEPVRGGALAKLSADHEAVLRGLQPDASIASWAFRWLQTLPGIVATPPSIVTTLSGMSNMEQLEDNLATYESEWKLSPEELQEVNRIAKEMQDIAPCTGCRYCVDKCPVGLDIPTLLMLANDMKFSTSGVVGMIVEGMKDGKRPQDCIGCGACSQMCPQGIDIPAALGELSAKLETLPKWADVCRARAAEAAALREAEAAALRETGE